MDTSSLTRDSLNVVANQQRSKSTDPLAKIRPLISKKPNLVQSLSLTNTIQISPGFRILNTRIESNDNPSYEPLVTISDEEHSEEEDFVLPVQKLTREELREELKIFQSTNANTGRALLDNDNDDDIGELQFRTHQPFKRSSCCNQLSLAFNKGSCIIL